MALIGAALWLGMVAYFVSADLAVDGQLQWAYWGALGSVPLPFILFRWQLSRAALLAGTIWGVLSSLGFVVVDLLDAVPGWSPLAIAPVAMLIALGWLARLAGRVPGR
jgi:thiamine transporter ThiT